MKTKINCIALLLILLTSCDILRSDSNNGTEWISTDRTVYIAEEPLSASQSGEADSSLHGYHFQMVVSLENKSDMIIYVQKCPDPGHLKFQTRLYSLDSISSEDYPDVPEEGLPFVASSYAIHCEQAPNAVAIEPGAIHTASIRVFGPKARDGITGEPSGIIEGDFQLALYEAGTCLDDDGNIPDECRFSIAEMPRSNVFEVQLEN